MAKAVSRSKVISKKFYVASPDQSVVKMIVDRGHYLAKTPNEKGIDAVLFTGGEDVTPFLYGERIIKGTTSNPIRDMKETALYRMFPSTTAKIGICRGAQFLNVMNGGALWQDVNNHSNGPHLARIVGNFGDRSQNTIHDLMVTSTHHQMMIPTDLGDVWLAANLATRKESDAKTYVVSSGNDDSHGDPEVVAYWMTNTLCFQPHPEYNNLVCRSYFWECVDHMIYSSKERLEMKNAQG